MCPLRCSPIGNRIRHATSNLMLMWNGNQKTWRRVLDEATDSSHASRYQLLYDGIQFIENYICGSHR